MVEMSGAFRFVDGGRTYDCHVEAPHRGRSEAWWWFGVHGDRNRYAPFRADVADTEASVRARIVAYYDARLASRGDAGWQTRGGTPTAR